MTIMNQCKEKEEVKSQMSHKGKRVRQYTVVEKLNVVEQATVRGVFFAA